MGRGVSDLAASAMPSFVADDLQPIEASFETVLLCFHFSLRIIATGARRAKRQNTCIYATMYSRSLYF